MSTQPKQPSAEAIKAASEAIANLLDRIQLYDARYIKSSSAWLNLAGSLSVLKQKNRTAFSAALSEKMLPEDVAWVARHYWAMMVDGMPDFRQVDADAGDPWDPEVAGDTEAQPPQIQHEAPAPKGGDEGKGIVQTGAEDIMMADEPPASNLEDVKQVAIKDQSIQAVFPAFEPEKSPPQPSPPKAHRRIPGGPARSLYDPPVPSYKIPSLPVLPEYEGMYLDSVAISEGCHRCFADSKHCFPPALGKMDSDTNANSRCLRCASGGFLCKTMKDVIVHRAGYKDPEAHLHPFTRQAVVAPAEDLEYTVGEQQHIIALLEAEVGQLTEGMKRVGQLEGLMGGLIVRELAREDPARAHAVVSLSSASIIKEASGERLKQLARDIGDSSRPLRTVLEENGIQVTFGGPSALADALHSPTLSPATARTSATALTSKFGALAATQVQHGGDPPTAFQSPSVLPPSRTPAPPPSTASQHWSTGQPLPRLGDNSSALRTTTSAVNTARRGFAALAKDDAEQGLSEAVEQLGRLGTPSGDSNRGGAAPGGRRDMETGNEDDAMGLAEGEPHAA